MTTTEEQINTDERFKDWEKNQRAGRVCAGFIVIFAAVLFFLKEANFGIPAWVFTWPVLLIAIGIISAVKHGFRNFAWVIMISVGTIFLLGDLIPDLSFDKYKIPLILLIVGLLLIFKPKHRQRQYARYQFRHNHKHHYHHFAGNTEANNTSDEYIVLNNIFSGTKKNIISKDFKGGDIKNTFGGCEINLMQADILNEAVLTINQQFGGVKLVIPSNWVLKSDLECMFAGMEDHRPMVNVTEGSNPKTLILRGRVIMGGVEIVSY